MIGRSGWALVLGLGVAGLGLGLGAGSVTRSAPIAAPAPSSADVEDRAGAGSCDAIEARVGAERDTLRELQLRARLFEGQLATIGGVPVPWPDDATRAARERSARALVGALVDAVPGFPHATVDCSEPPCLLGLQQRADGLGVFTLDDDVESGLGLVEASMASHGFQDGFSDMLGELLPGPRGQRLQLYVVSLRAPDEGDDPRDAVRMDRLNEELRSKALAP